MGTRKRRVRIGELVRAISSATGSGGDASLDDDGILGNPSDLSAPRLVVFACGNDVGRAHLATMWFGMLADPAKARAVCASSSRLARAEPKIAAVLRKDELPPGGKRPLALTRELLLSASLVITIGDSSNRGELDLPGPTRRREHWLVPEIDGPEGLDRARDMRDLLRSRVAMLAFMEGWGRADISREAARVTRIRRPTDVGGSRP
jgi:protein-tyrosine-phosphatase